MALDIHARTRLLLGASGFDRLAASQIVVFGLGGVGSYAAEALARAGVGKLRLVDFDIIRESNFNRQLPACLDTLGRPKVEAMAERLLRVNPDLVVDAFPERFQRDNAERLLAGEIDFAVDAIDSLSAKVQLIVTCREREIRFISSMGSASRLRPDRIRVGDLFESRGCPLAKMVRKRLRRRGIKSGVPAVFSDELPILSGRSAGASGDAGANDEEDVHGTISYMPGLFGLHCAGYVIQELLTDIPYERRGDTAKEPAA